MKIKSIITIAVIVLLSGKVFSQTYEPPLIYEFTKAEDYTLFEKDIIDAAKWLEATPLDREISKRQKVSAFVVKWIDGSPTVNVEINTTIVDFDKKNQGMMVLFMAGCARYVLENNYSKDMRAKHKYALRSMIAVYKSGKGITKDKKMDKLVKSDDQGKLDDWLDENLKVNP